MMTHLTIKSRVLAAALATLLSLPVAKAEVNGRLSPDSQGWYVGLQGGMPFGVSTFSSFGYDKTRPGGAAGLYGGYRVNNILSAELSAKYGWMSLYEQSCCAGRGYRLGSDGEFYRSAVAGMDSWEYTDLKSGVRMGQLGARVNVNLLGLFRKTAGSRWEIAVSPHIYAAVSRADIKTVSGGEELKKGSSDFHLGYGADLQIACQLNSRLKLGLYSGLTDYTGSRIDGMPVHIHTDNYVWESGIRLGISLGKKKKLRPVQPVPAPVSEVPDVRKEEPAPVETVSPEDPVEVATEAAEQETADGQEMYGQPEVAFPVVHFRFNSLTLDRSEEGKLGEILDSLNAHPYMSIMLSGWCDTKGSTEVNLRMSLKRAEAVKAWLVKKGISPERISTEGNGSDSTREPASARRVESSLLSFL